MANDRNDMQTKVATTTAWAATMAREAFVQLSSSLKTVSDNKTCLDAILSHLESKIASKPEYIGSVVVNDSRILDKDEGYLCGYRSTAIDILCDKKVQLYIDVDMENLSIDRFKFEVVPDDPSLEPYAIFFHHRDEAYSQGSHFASDDLDILTWADFLADFQEKDLRGNSAMDVDTPFSSRCVETAGEKKLLRETLKILGAANL